jgi:hypothetical protein
MSNYILISVVVSGCVMHKTGPLVYAQCKTSSETHVRDKEIPFKRKAQLSLHPGKVTLF